MDKNAIKKYAVWARTELITRVSQRAEKYDISAEADVNASSINGVLLSDAEKKQRKALIEQVKHKGFDQVMEEVAYTWFNRFIALRFMEVNGYLPSHIRVFTDDNNNFKPQILAEAIHLELDGLDMEKVYEMKNNNDNDELYKYLIITQCNDLSKILPRMFQKIADYTELLFPDNILREGSVIEQMISLISQNSWDVHSVDEDGKEQGQVQIIGWLYQYYNTEPKDQVFAEVKKKKKITKEKIPAATQLFTPNWIVKYMVENSLGKLWVDGHPESCIDSNFEFFIAPGRQEDTVDKQISELNEVYADMRPESIKCIDPCCGSGHILSYMFDVLISIYQDYGTQTSDAVKSIIRNNIFGLDIDERASQLAYFSVMMKAVQYDRRFFRRKNEFGEIDVPQPNIYAITESNNIDENAVNYITGDDKALSKDFVTVLSSMRDAKEFGSLVTTPKVDYDRLFLRIEEINNDISIYKDYIKTTVLPLLHVAKILSDKYQIVITNPPYMAMGSANQKINAFAKEKYPDSKSDLFAIFIEKCMEFTCQYGFTAMITQHAWMFLSSYESLRSKVFSRDIISMSHLGARAFEDIGGEVVQTTSFVLRNSNIGDYKGTYFRLVDANSQQEKEQLFLSAKERYMVPKSMFETIPGKLCAYWASPRVIDKFKKPSIEKYVLFRQGMATSDNNRFLRLWFEVNVNKINFSASGLEDAQQSGKKWFAYNKGGSYRKWYGNAEYVVNWENDGKEMKEFTATLTQGMNVRLKSREYYFKECYSWSKISGGNISFRYYPRGFAFDVAGCCVFNCGDNLLYFLALSNSVITKTYADFLSPTLNYELDHLKKIPVIFSDEYKEEIEKLTKENIDLCMQDWNSYETSWDFSTHPLINGENLIEKSFEKWASVCRVRFDTLKENEERINRDFIRIYDLDNEITPDIDVDSVSISLADRKREIISLISYAVGCMFGRYSLDKPGLIYAGGVLDTTCYKSYPIDNDGIIPICEEEYFSDDIVNRFVEFIRTVYGNESLEKNLKFIADSLDGVGSPRDVIRNYFINSFYADHCSTYSSGSAGKRPIYWLFDSGKKNGFKCLVYMHRYKADTLARIRTGYVHELQSRYRTEIEDLNNRLIGAQGSEKVKYSKRLKRMMDQYEELHKYEEKIHHLADQMISIDLDDGFKKNYEIFTDVVAKV